MSTNIENLNVQMKAINDQTHMPKFEHNVKLILDKVEGDIQKFNNQYLRHESEGEWVSLERYYMVETTSRQY